MMRSVACRQVGEGILRLMAVDNLPTTTACGKVEKPFEREQVEKMEAGQRQSPRQNVAHVGRLVVRAN